MKILVLQLKRIGDLVLTTPAIRHLMDSDPQAQVTLAVQTSTAPLLPAIPRLKSAMVFGNGRGWAPWQQALTGRFDAVVDLTGSDRSALVATLSGAPRRITFDWVEKYRLRSLIYREFIASPVREHHTVDHYLDLARGFTGQQAPTTEAGPELEVPAAARQAAQHLLSEHGIAGNFILLHPGSAREEKYWKADRWAELVTHLLEKHRMPVVFTGGSDPFERAHLDWIHTTLVRCRGSARDRQATARTHTSVSTALDRSGVVDLAGKIDLLTLSALVARARAVVSCDTAVVHLAAAFRRPQLALFGPTNPFHWRPRHPKALVLSAAEPDAPLTEFTPRMKGAPMERLSTEAVVRATDSLLQMQLTR